MTEEQLQRAVIELARLTGWRVAHFRPALTSHGWRTAVEADGAGFPDLVLVRRQLVVFAELKSDRGTLTPGQREWADALTEAGQEMFVWRPRDWSSGAIEQFLKRWTTTR